MAPMANGRHVSFNWNLSLWKLECWRLGVFSVPVYSLPEKFLSQFQMWTLHFALHTSFLMGFWNGWEVIWNPDHLDRIGKNSTYVSEQNPKPIENGVLSAKWNVHIWTWLRCCSSRLNTALICPQISVPTSEDLNLFKFHWQWFAIQSWLRNALSNATRRAQAHLLSKLSKLSKSSITRLTEF